MEQFIDTTASSSAKSAPPPEVRPEPEDAVVVNLPPEIQSQQFSIDEHIAADSFDPIDGPVIVGAVQTNDPDSSRGLSFNITGGNEDGRFAIDPDTGVMTVNKALNYEDTGQYDLTVEVTDNNGATDTAVVAINVNDVHEAPVAAADTGTSEENEPLIINVLANDSDVDQDDTPANFTLHHVDIVNDN